MYVLVDSLASRSSNENRLDQEKFNEIIRPSSECILSRRTTPAGMFARESPRENLAPDSTPNRRSYKLIRSSTSYVYRTIPEISENPISLNEQFSQLTLPQLELLEHYDPLISTRIGAPFIPVQMLARPRDAQLSAKRSAEEIERDYPK